MNEAKYGRMLASRSQIVNGTKVEHFSGDQGIVVPLPIGAPGWEEFEMFPGAVGFQVQSGETYAVSFLNLKIVNPTFNFPEGKSHA